MRRLSLCVCSIRAVRADKSTGWRDRVCQSRHAGSLHTVPGGRAQEGARKKGAQKKRATVSFGRPKSPGSRGSSEEECEPRRWRSAGTGKGGAVPARRQNSQVEYQQGACQPAEGGPECGFAAVVSSPAAARGGGGVPGTMRRCPGRCSNPGRRYSSGPLRDCSGQRRRRDAVLLELAIERVARQSEIACGVGHVPAMAFQLAQ